MSLCFQGGERIQRGRGIDGILRFVKSLFTPFVKSIGSKVVKTAKSKVGKQVVNALKNQVIDSGMNVMSDALRGNDLKESVHNEVGNARMRAANGIDKLKRKRKNSVFKKKKRANFFEDE